jgi:branched-chain amino acid transport system substrate-binding protein
MLLVEAVLDKTYPLGTQDFSSLLAEAAASEADAFVAFSYPPDTFAMTKQARLAGYNPRVFYTGVGTAFPIYPALAEGDVQGVMSLGGIDSTREEMVAYRARHKQVTGQDADYWASPVIYSSLQMLVQAIERRGLDREAVTQELATGTFDTVIGAVALENNQLRDLWYLGQWQNGAFVGIAPADRPGAAAPIVPKPAWA